jgi:protein gp37
MATKIEWATDSWNPITGCTPISEGCRNCYAKRMATRLRGRCGYPADEPFRPGTFHVDKIDINMWPPGKRVFVSSMGDFFHPEVSREDQAQVYEVVGLHPGVMFMFLTKRPENVMPYWIGVRRNVWLGVTVENDNERHRIDTLRSIPAAVRFISFEPLLSAIRNIRLVGINWVICGGETGPGARPMHPDWPRSLRDQCQTAGVPFFFKHWGAWLPDDYNTVTKSGRTPKRCSVYSATGEVTSHSRSWNTADMMWCPKHVNSRLLDGREWNEYPKVG